jgi:hypothetical protein
MEIRRIQHENRRAGDKKYSSKRALLDLLIF